MHKIKRMILKKFLFGIAQHRNWFKHLKPMTIHARKASSVCLFQDFKKTKNLRQKAIVYMMPFVEN